MISIHVCVDVMIVDVNYMVDVNPDETIHVTPIPIVNTRCHDCATVDVMNQVQDRVCGTGHVTFDLCHCHDQPCHMCG